MMPNGLPLGYRQWGLFFNANGLSTITYPIALSSKPLAIIPIEGDPSGWNTSNGIAIAGGDIKTASNTQANILSKWVLNGSAVEQGGQSVIVLIIGGLNSGDFQPIIQTMKRQHLMSFIRLHSLRVLFLLLPHQLEMIPLTYLMPQLLLILPFGATDHLYQQQQ